MKVRSIFLLILTGLLILVTTASAVTLSAGNVQVATPGTTATVNIVLDQVPAGLAGYNLSIGLSNTSVAEIVSVSFPGWANRNIAGWPHQNANSTIPSDSVWIKAADLNNLIVPGAKKVTLATITIRGDTVGTTPVTLAVRQISDDAGTNIVPTRVNGSVAVRLPDLVIASVDGPVTAGQGERIPVVNTISNLGTYATDKPFLVQFFLSVDGTQNNFVIGKRKITALAAGASDTATTSLAVPPKITPGTWYVKGIVDPNRQIAEARENNNARFDPVATTITPRPDLVFSWIDGPGTGTIGQRISITLNVTNSGASPVTGLSYVQMYLSPDTVITGSDKLLKKFMVPPLGADQSITIGGSPVVQASITPGSYYLGGILDYGNLVAEQDEKNNKGFDPVPIQVVA
ncbi:MAG: hypothetical protein LUQ25_07455 [Methanoregulaceae archaeon]|nr:hypothetical protein [Methanoregulaceae archaeon]